MAAAIETKQLTKSYKSRIQGNISVVDSLDLVVEEGEIFGFLGPNGAGKTTTIKMLLGIIYPTSGEGYILGKEIGDMDVHKLISYLPERPYYYDYMTGPELLKFYGSLFGINDTARFDSLLERVNLHRDKDKPISKYSKGMMQRIGLAQSLLNDPKLLFLDEPTSGFDPIARREIRDLILSFRDEGRTVFVTSHELEEVERICDRVCIINRGKIVRQGRLSELLKGTRTEIEILGSSVPAVITNIKGVTTRPLADGFLLDVPEIVSVNDVVDATRGAGVTITKIEPRKLRLEDLYEQAVGNNPGPIGDPGLKKTITVEEETTA